MRRLIWLGILGVATIGLPLAALAGPNEGVALVVHGNVDGVDTGGDPCTGIPIPAICDDLKNVAQPDAGGVEWFLVIAASLKAQPLSFNVITFGVGDYESPTDCYIGFYGPCRGDLDPLEIPSSGWPGPRTGTSVSWAPACLDGSLVPIYYFGVYVYADCTIPLADEYPGQDANIVSCQSPPEEDPISAFNVMNCGNVGGDEGTVQVCPPTPTQKTTWGQIKNIYH